MRPERRLGLGPGLETEVLAEQAFNGFPRLNNGSTFRVCFPNLILEQKENKARGKKFDSASMGVSLGRIFAVFG
jgi:hypothetical protein